MSTLKSLLIATLCIAGQSTLADSLSWKPDLPRAKTAFERETRVALREGHHVEPTIFPGFYAVRSGQPGAPSAYFREDMAWLGNVRTQGWSIRSPLESNSEGKRNWLKEQIKYLPFENLIFIQRRKPAVAIIWSAPDCPFCRKLERALEQEDVSAFIAPIGLTEEGYRQAANIYCSSNAAKSWQAMIRGNTSSEPTSADCSYPREMMNDIGFFLGMGRMATPIVVFADGSTISGWDDHQALALLREKIKQSLFFPNPNTDR
ncbi:thioredoxin fold domain-containing protein [Methylomonas fluvii]|uniref:Thioredoxin fold domain-containing protein n=1 Tax=Methylomonas fluvii TaxID=1854564 RepID=A0ABR9D7D3_9GAMM|nr:thioredoxin fold domain-containing protein [Methylomonas fluvii]MBD9359022.1 thioredoxin fold domain-containing protein [Methylomonas fluvii]CAD6871693.1 hypothetical protein [Methylomonas fluvii]